jgi:6-phosphofructokinase 1
MGVRRIGVLTGGGDCPGLNAVIRAVTTAALRSGAEVVGVHDGFLGLIEGRTRPLVRRDVEGILSEGGTILGTHNRANPFRQVTGMGPDGTPVTEDVSDRCVATLRAAGIDGLIVVGGDGTMTIAAELAGKLARVGLDVPIVGVPKTIDNDLVGTDLTFGFLSAVGAATDALDRVRTTAASHHRAMVVEVMGRNAGWIALYAGLAGGADAVLIPEVAFTFGALEAMIERRRAAGERHSLVCVAEGAAPAGGSQTVARRDPTSPDPVRLGGVGRLVAEELERRTGIESRYVVLGHVQRGGSPVPADRILGTMMGCRAVEMLMGGVRDRMVAIRGVADLGSSGVTDVALTEPAGKQRLVPVGKGAGREGEHRLLAAARAMGVCVGDC